MSAFALDELLVLGYRGREGRFGHDGTGTQPGLRLAQILGRRAF